MDRVSHSQKKTFSIKRFPVALNTSLITLLAAYLNMYIHVQERGRGGVAGFSWFLGKEILDSGEKKRSSFVPISSNTDKS